MKRSKTILAATASIAALTASAAQAGEVEKTLYSFQSGLQGDSPIGGLVSDSAGNLYGAAAFGGTSGFGLIYELTPNGKNGWTYNVIYNFQGSDGAFPEANLVLDAAGNLYGTTSGGGALDNQNLGTVFELSHNGSWSISKSYSFTGGSDGFDPTGSVVLDAAGNVYATAKEADNYGGFGSVIELTPNENGWSEQTIHHFTYGDDGAYPSGGLTIDRKGDLYGTTYDAGAGRNGVVFKFHHTSKGWKETVLHAFTGGDDGAAPLANVVFDRAGNLYGTTLQGNSAFELVKPAHEDERAGQPWPIVQIHKFGIGTDASSPSGITIDNKGNLYGPAGSGGATGYGAIYKLSPVENNGTTTWNETVLWNFTGGANGGFPSGTLIFDKSQSGRLYGTASQGTSNYGVIFDVKK